MDYGGLVGQVEGWRTAGAQIQGSKMKGTMVVKRRAWWQAVQRKRHRGMKWRECKIGQPCCGALLGQLFRPVVAI